jgi:hypothetical protein
VARLFPAQQHAICAADCVCHRYPHLIPVGHGCITTTDITSLVDDPSIHELWRLGTKYRPWLANFTLMTPALRSELITTFTRAFHKYCAQVEEDRGISGISGCMNAAMPSAC